MNPTIARTAAFDPAADRPRRIVALALAVLTLLSLSMLPATALAKPVLAAATPTIVLVHGSWAGPAGWDQVAAGLQKDGYATVAPTLDLATLAGDVAHVRAVLDSIPGDKLLVGHSYGGAVIS